jgi:hypothetical protein
MRSCTQAIASSAPAIQNQGVLVGDLALLIESYDFGAKALKVGECVLELALAQLDTRAVELADQASVVFGGVLADEGGVLGLHLQRGDISLALIDGLGLGGFRGNPGEQRHQKPEQDTYPYTCPGC